MDLQNKTIMILGGSGLVGRAVAARLLTHQPARLVLVALFESEVRETAASLEDVRGDTVIDVEWGNVFLATEAARLPWREMLDDDGLRNRVISDVFDELRPDIVERSLLTSLLGQHRPHAVVDCINTATAFAYQDVFTSARSLLAKAKKTGVSVQDVEQHLLTLTMPQLIRHIQIATEAMSRAGTQAYVKIGTSGTGGMGLNIPYTHSEERPSRTLLTKAAVAGAHSLLLFLLGRTPGGPATAEIKPTAAIAWRNIAYGAIRRGGREIGLVDCPDPLPVDAAFGANASGWIDLGRSLESVYIDVGENGVFAREEFETVTALGQMEFITAEEVADYVVFELQGRPSGKDVVAALDGATAGPTYRAGVLRAAALARLEELEETHGVRSVAFEMLGPPRLTKMLYESFILGHLRSSVRALGESEPHTLSAEARALVESDSALRSTMLSIGLPILLGDDLVYRGELVLVAPEGDVERAVTRGWVDLRPERCETWIARASRIVRESMQRSSESDGSGSGVEWDGIHPDDPIAPAKFAKWVFRTEDDGERIKR